MVSESLIGFFCLLLLSQVWHLRLDVFLCEIIQNSSFFWWRCRFGVCVGSGWNWWALRVRAVLSVSVLPSVSECSAAEKTQINNSSSSRSHQVSGSAPHRGGGGMIHYTSEEMRLQFGWKGEKAHTQRPLLSLWGSWTDDNRINIRQRWPSTCPLNEFDIGIKSERRRSRQNI